MFSTGDTTGADNVFATGYVDHQRPARLDLVGPAEFRAIVDGARRSMPNLTVTIEGEVIEDRGFVAFRLRWSSDNAERETLEMLRMEHGKVVEHWGGEAWSRPRQNEVQR